jgi:hypothetical protein
MHGAENQTTECMSACKSMMMINEDDDDELKSE